MNKRHIVQEVHDGQVDTVLTEPVSQLHSIGIVCIGHICALEEHLVVAVNHNSCILVV